MSLIITLIILGIFLLIAELLVVPGVGVAGILGLSSLAVASYLAFVQFGTTLGLLITFIAVLTLVVFVIFALRSNTWRKLSLDTVITKEETPNRQVYVGLKGEAMTRLSPIGKAKFIIEGDIFRFIEVTSVDNIISAGSEIEVAYIDNNKVFVKEIK